MRKKTLLLLSSMILLALLFTSPKSWPFVGSSLSKLPKLGQLFLYTNSLLKTRQSSEQNTTHRISPYGKLEIGFSELGVPYIFGENEYSTAFGIGYCHGRDRLFQMEMVSRTIKGELCEVAGAPALKSDRFWKKFNFEKRAENYLANIASKDSNLIKHMLAYVDGINFYANMLSEWDRPIEYKLLNFLPKNFTVKDMYYLLVYMNYDLTYDENDLSMHKLYSMLPDSLIEEYFPLLAPHLIPIHDVAINTLPKSQEIKSDKGIKVPQGRFLSASSLGKGSNNFVVSGNKTKSGNPILCNDTHLKLMIPGIWYEMHIQVGDRYAHGFNIPGSPFVLSGFNNKLAWGITNATWDLTDFYSLEWNDEGKYMFEGQWLPPEVDTLEIKIKDESSRFIHSTTTKYGLLDSIEGNVLAVNWIGLENNMVPKAFYMLQKSETVSQAISGLKNFGSPPQNFALADNTGNIALCTAGKIAWHEEIQIGVLKGEGAKNLPRYLLSNEMFTTINPEKGYLFSANQAQTSDREILLQLNKRFGSNSRARRIDEMLGTEKQFDIEELIKVQQDWYDLEWRFIKEKSIESSPTEFKKLLSHWNGQCDTSSIAASIFITLKSELVKTFVRKLTFDLPLLPQSEHLFYLLETKDELISAGGVISVKELFQESWENVILVLGEKLGADFTNWQYGKLHSTKITHLTSLKALSAPDFSSGGSNRTVNVAHGNPNSFGPSMRAIIELNPEGNKAIMTLPCGQSGRFNSPNYLNQLEDYIFGRYHEVVLPKEFVSTQYKTTIEFTQ